MAMNTARARGYCSGLVDLTTGQISREIFVNEDIYAEEQERVFARSWLFVGHESQLPNPGDFFVSRMGEESVILCRDRAGAVHVFLNSCRHRGMKVCRYDDGNTTVFTCPYHGWSYGTDGALVGVPFFREAYHSELDRSKWRLVEVARDCGTEAHLIDSAAEVREDWLVGKRVVGISSGASAPEHLVQELIEFFRARGVGEISEFHVVNEDVRFMLPKPIRELASAGETR